MRNMVFHFVDPLIFVYSSRLPLKAYVMLCYSYFTAIIRVAGWFLFTSLNRVLTIMHSINYVYPVFSLSGTDALLPVVFRGL
jgi:hypothetical protein